VTSDRGAIALAERVLEVLAEGSFSATYKFALLTAMLDLCIENTSAHGAPPTTLTTRQLAAKVLELYWNHAVPYGRQGVLRQGGGSTGGQAEIVRQIQTARTGWAARGSDTLLRAQVAHGAEFARLLDFAEWKLIEMPIPRLQVLGRKEDRFLYEYHWTQGIRQSTVSRYQRGAASDFDNRLLWLPGVAENLVRLNGVLRPLLRREWAVMVAGMNRLPEADLERFLFGAGRSALAVVRNPLRDLQNDRCFYCHERLGSRAEVDHFVPWSRYPDDGLDNLVASDERCNGSKRDFLAAGEHVERWVERTRALDRQLHVIARQSRWHRDPQRTLSVARAIYLRLPEGARLWLRGPEFAPYERERIGRALA
jgi:hypothetical protein